LQAHSTGYVEASILACYDGFIGPSLIADYNGYVDSSIHACHDALIETLIPAHYTGEVDVFIIACPYQPIITAKKRPRYLHVMMV
jgi:hypothetical protein